MELQVQNAGLRKRLERLCIENEALEKRQREKDEVWQILLVGFADCGDRRRRGLTRKHETGVATQGELESRPRKSAAT